MKGQAFYTVALYCKIKTPSCKWNNEYSFDSAMRAL